ALEVSPTGADASDRGPRPPRHVGPRPPPGAGPDRRGCRVVSPRGGPAASRGRAAHTNVSKKFLAPRLGRMVGSASHPSAFTFAWAVGWNLSLPRRRSV